MWFQSKNVYFAEAAITGFRFLRHYIWLTSERNAWNHPVSHSASIGNYKPMYDDRVHSYMHCAQLSRSVVPLKINKCACVWKCWIDHHIGILIEVLWFFTYTGKWSTTLGVVVKATWTRVNAAYIFALWTSELHLREVPRSGRLGSMCETWTGCFEPTPDNRSKRRCSECLPLRHEQEVCSQCYTGSRQCPPFVWTTERRRKLLRVTTGIVRYVSSHQIVDRKASGDDRIISIPRRTERCLNSTLNWNVSISATSHGSLLCMRVQPVLWVFFCKDRTVLGSSVLQSCLVHLSDWFVRPLQCSENLSDFASRHGTERFKHYH